MYNVRARTRPCGVFGGCSVTGRGFCLSIRVFLASMIPSLLLVHLHKIMTLLRPNGRRLRTWQRSNSFSAIVEHWRKVVEEFKYTERVLLSAGGRVDEVVKGCVIQGCEIYIYIYKRTHEILCIYEMLLNFGYCSVCHRGRSGSIPH